MFSVNNYVLNVVLKSISKVVIFGSVSPGFLIRGLHETKFIHNNLGRDEPIQQVSSVSFSGERSTTGISAIVEINQL